MGTNNSKDETNRVLDEPWRKFESGGEWSNAYRSKLVEDVKSQLPRGEINSPKIMLFGPVMAGKSSFINSVSTIDQDRISNPQGTGYAGRSFTLKQTRFRGEKILKNVRLYDTMGMQTATGGIDNTDIIKTVEGKVKIEYEYKSEEAIKDESKYYINDPTLAEKCHCVILVMDANNIMQQSTDELLKKKIQKLQHDVQDCDAPVVLILSKIDTICGHVNKDISKVFLSANVEKCVNYAHQLFGVTPLNIHPVRNYSKETGLDYNMDILILLALRHAVRMAYDYLKKIEDQKIPEEVFVNKETA